MTSTIDQQTYQRLPSPGLDYKCEHINSEIFHSRISDTLANSEGGGEGPPPPIPSFGKKISKKQGDGVWCPTCKDKGFYSWLDFKYKAVDNDGIWEVYAVCQECDKWFITKVQPEVNFKN